MDLYKLSFAVQFFLLGVAFTLLVHAVILLIRMWRRP